MPSPVYYAIGATVLSMLLGWGWHDARQRAAYNEYRMREAQRDAQALLRIDDILQQARAKKDVSCECGADQRTVP